MSGQAAAPNDPGIIIFDGPCRLCQAFVAFVIRRDSRASYRFAAVQSEAGRRILEEHAMDWDDPQTVVLARGGVLHTRSDAVLEIIRELDQPWPLLRVLRFIPARLRNVLYTAVARRRSRWFGRDDRCTLPQPGTGDRFLS